MIDVRRRLPDGDLSYHSLPEAERAGLGAVSRLPTTVRILLEMLLRGHELGQAPGRSVRALPAWPAPPPEGAELPFVPARVLLQDFTGVPAVVDLAAMRSAM